MRLQINYPTAGKDYGTEEPRMGDICVNSAAEKYSINELTPTQARNLGACLIRAADAVEACEAAEKEIAQLLTPPAPIEL